MEKDNEAVNLKPKNMFVPITVVQIITVAVLLAAVLIIKSGFNNCFAKLQKWCKNNVLEPTQITANFDEED